MQSMISAWLGLSIPWIFACLVTFYLGTAALIVWLSFGSPLSGRILSFKGVVAPFFGSTAIIFGLLIAFLSNDIWDRNKQAERIVLTESDTLLALHSLSAASGADDKTLRRPSSTTNGPSWHLNSDRRRRMRRSMRCCAKLRFREPRRMSASRD